MRNLTQENVVRILEDSPWFLWRIRKFAGCSGALNLGFLSFKHSMCAHQKQELCCYLPIGGTSALLRFAGANREQTPGFDSVRMQQQAPCGT